MRQCFSSYPELVCVCATYKLIELRFPRYIILVEDGNGRVKLYSSIYGVTRNRQYIFQNG